MTIGRSNLGNSSIYANSSQGAQRPAVISPVAPAVQRPIIDIQTNPLELREGDSVTVTLPPYQERGLAGLLVRLGRLSPGASVPVLKGKIVGEVVVLNGNVEFVLQLDRSINPSTIPQKTVQRQGWATGFSSREYQVDGVETKNGVTTVNVLLDLKFAQKQGIVIKH